MARGFWLPLLRPLSTPIRAVSQLLWSVKSREVWFSLRENHVNAFSFGLHQFRNCFNAAIGLFCVVFSPGKLHRCDLHPATVVAKLLLKRRDRFCASGVYLGNCSIDRPSRVQ